MPGRPCPTPRHPHPRTHRLTRPAAFLWPAPPLACPLLLLQGDQAGSVKTLLDLIISRPNFAEIAKDLMQAGVHVAAIATFGMAQRQAGERSGM